LFAILSAAKNPFPAMKTVNLHALPEEEQRSPKGKYQSFCKNLSVALGARRRIGEPGDYHPFDFQIRRVPPGKSVCPYHSHTTQWEMFIVVSGAATVRRNGETHAVTAGEVFIHPPGTAHQITNASSTEDLVLQIIADNPPADVYHYPDSQKYGSRPLGKYFRLQEVDYFDGEE
jgi:uncharacterized cupin superfamily protein